MLAQGLLTLALGFAGCESEAVDARAQGGAAASAGMSESGNGGASGASGAGSAGQSALPALVGCDGRRTPIDADVVRSCVLKVSCSPFDPVDLISACVTLNTQLTYPSADCRSAMSCADVTRCTGEGFTQTPCAADDPAWKCDGSKVVNCRDGYFLDCAAYAGSCALYTDATQGERAGCQVLPQCSDDAGQLHCAGSVLYECEQGVGFGQDCAQSGRVCLDDGVSAGCFDALPSCDADSMACLDDVATTCSGGELVQSNCGSVGLRCDPSSLDCLAPGCGPEKWESCEETCSGSELTLCYGGAPYSIDCKDFGFASCETFRRGDSVVYAVCAN